MDAGRRLETGQLGELGQDGPHAVGEAGDAHAQVGDLGERPVGAAPQVGGQLGGRGGLARAERGGEVLVHLAGRDAQVRGQLEGLAAAGTVLAVVGAGELAEELEAVVGPGDEGGGDGGVRLDLGARRVDPREGRPGDGGADAVPAVLRQGDGDLDVGVAAGGQDAEDLDDEVGRALVLGSPGGGVLEGRGQDDARVGLLAGGHPEPVGALRDGAGVLGAHDRAGGLRGGGPGAPEARVVRAVDELGAAVGQGEAGVLSRLAVDAEVRQRPGGHGDERGVDEHRGAGGVAARRLDEEVVDAVAQVAVRDEVEGAGRGCGVALEGEPPALEQPGVQVVQERLGGGPGCGDGRGHQASSPAAVAASCSPGAVPGWSAPAGLTESQ